MLHSSISHIKLLETNPLAYHTQVGAATPSITTFSTMAFNITTLSITTFRIIVYKK
jgi:hypothetical protein